MGHLTAHPIISLDSDVSVSVRFLRRACNKTHITIHSPGHEMRPETFSGEPYLVGSAAWRCRLHKRGGGGAYYRQVLGKPAWLDAATVVLRTRKAHLAELFQGALSIEQSSMSLEAQGVPAPPSPDGRRDFRDPAWARSGMQGKMGRRILQNFNFEKTLPGPNNNPQPQFFGHNYNDVKAEASTKHKTVSSWLNCTECYQLWTPSFKLSRSRSSRP